jgi:hypothetical protein
MSRRLSGAIALALLLAAASASPRTAHAESTGRPLLATLDGERVSIAMAAQYHCHDLIVGQLTCFSSEAQRDQAVAMLLSSERIAAVDEAMPLTVNGYVVAYVDASFRGGSVVLSHDYDNLGDIGWNDRISSYRDYTTMVGAFYVDANESGNYQSFCCLAQVSYVGDYFNDTFSSVDIP